LTNAGPLRKRLASSVIGQARLEDVTPRKASEAGVSHPPTGVRPLNHPERVQKSIETFYIYVLKPVWNEKYPPSHPFIRPFIESARTTNARA
jgi:hypothetical protein